MALLVIIVAAAVLGWYYHANGTRHDQPIDDKAKPLLGNDHTVNTPEISVEMRSFDSVNEQGDQSGAQLSFNIAKTAAEKLACAVAWRDGTDLRLTPNQQKQIDYHDLQLDSAAVIGDGGSCIVYKAEVYGMQCAVKALASEASKWEEEQFNAEIKLLSAVHHPYRPLSILCMLHQRSSKVLTSGAHG
jgi:hypothetical protein